MANERSGSRTPAGAKPADAARPAQDAPPGEQADGNGGPRPDLSEMKRKFREALERKRGAHAGSGAEEAQGTGKVHGSHGPAASRRSFRRKSGG